MTKEEFITEWEKMTQEQIFKDLPLEASEKEYEEIVINKLKHILPFIEGGY